MGKDGGGASPHTSCASTWISCSRLRCPGARRLSRVGRRREARQPRQRLIATPVMARASKASPKRKRASLDAQKVLGAASRVLERDGEAGLTFRRLAVELGADPTAVYRYFRSKDDLLLAIADDIAAGVVDRVTSHADWRVTVRELLLETYRAYLRHPRLAILVSSRTTQGPGERRAIERMLEALHRAGFSDRQAAATLRALGDTTLAWAGMSAAFLALPTSVRAKDDAAWASTYGRATGEYPRTAAARDYFASSADSGHFPDALDLLLDGVASRLKQSRK